MSRGSKSSLKITLSDQDQKTLESWQRSTAISALLAMHGRIILLLATGKSITQTAGTVGISRRLVYKWAQRFLLKGIIGLERSSKRRTRKTEGKTRELAQRVRILALSDEDRYTLRSWQCSVKTPSGLAKRGRIILMLAAGSTVSETARTVGITRHRIYKWRRRFAIGGIKALYKIIAPKERKAEDSRIRKELFSILHSPPSEYGINRTSWKLGDLKKCLYSKGITVSKNVISRAIKLSGFRWRKAKIVLTSKDPQYREKIRRIQSILSGLGKNDRFFSVDEFGPFAIKKRGGLKLVGPGENPSIPQFQKSRGSLIITAALELSQNQVTHFYSLQKNTAEMITLLDVLLNKYKSCRKLYLSWDAASWHVSKQLYRRVEDLNKNDYRKNYGTPLVVLAPLPKSAQFLNVVESVFSGMAKAIIHNSNYHSRDEAKSSIDRYFQERNRFFRDNPRRAGNLIWGNERLPSTFSEANNCKDPKW